MVKSPLFIHASNVTGLGASQVVMSMIEAFIKNNERDHILFALPSSGLLSQVEVASHSVKLVHRWLPNSLSRIIECVFPKFFYPEATEAIVLGDIPLRGYKQQVVLVHQSNLVKPHINPHSSTSLAFRVMRWLFEWNLKDVKYVVVQTGLLKEQLIDSYPKLEGSIVVISQPAPSWFKPTVSEKRFTADSLILFYPAAGYPHKNHQIISELTKVNELCKEIECIVITLTPEEERKFDFSSSKVKCVGRLSPQACLEYYANVDALLYPSLAESYGLPLVEAMLSGLPIICADLPYAHWLCGEEAIYFNPEEISSLSDAISTLNGRLESGWRPDWRGSLAKLPETWTEVCQRFIRLL